MLSHFSSQKILIKVILITFFCPFTLFSQIGDIVRVDDADGISTKPAIVVGQSGNIYVVWIDGRDGWGNAGLYFARSIDGGASFEENIRIDHAHLNDYPPQIVIDRDENIYVVWSDEVSFENHDIFLVKSIDLGLSFQSRVRVDHAGGVWDEALSPTIAIDSAGVIYVIWSDHRTYGGYQLYLNKSFDGGETFLSDDIFAIENVGRDNFAPSITVDDSNGVYVVWNSFSDTSRILFSKSFNGGMTFNSPVGVDDNTLAGWPYVLIPHIAIDEQKDIYVIWSGLSFHLHHVYFDVSRNGGESFGEDIIVSDLMEPDTISRFPKFVLDDNNIYTVWEDYRNGNMQIYFDNSLKVDTIMFSSDQLITQDSVNNNVWPDITVDDTGSVNIVWSHVSTLPNEEIYFTKFRPDSLDINFDSFYEKEVSMQAYIMNYPNPFNNSTNIYYILTTEQDVEVAIYNILGYPVRKLFKGVQSKGIYTIQWDSMNNYGKLVSSGIYFVRVKANGSVYSKKILLLR